jgi:hypothetical protein
LNGWNGQSCHFGYFALVKPGKRPSRPQLSGSYHVLAITN